MGYVLDSKQLTSVLPGFDSTDHAWIGGGSEPRFVLSVTGGGDMTDLLRKNMQKVLQNATKQF